MIRADKIEEIASGYRKATVKQTFLTGSDYNVVVPDMRLDHRTAGMGTLVRVEIDQYDRFPLLVVKLDSGSLLTDDASNFRGGSGVIAPASSIADGWIFDLKKKTFEINLYGRTFPFTPKHAERYVGKKVRVKALGNYHEGEFSIADPACIKVGDHIVAHVTIEEVKVYLPQKKK